MFFFAVTVAGGSHNATWTELCPGRSRPMTDATESCVPKISPEFIASLRTSESTSRLIERKKRSAVDVSEDEEKVGGKLLKQSVDLSTTMKILQEEWSKSSVRKQIESKVLMAEKKLGMLEKRLAIERSELLLTEDPEEKLVISKTIKSILCEIRETPAN
jgi:hypothetical protein